MYAQVGQSNLRPHGWPSKPQGIRCLRSTACGNNFSERNGTPLFGLHMSDEKALDIAHHLVEGNGMRPTGRLCGGAPASQRRATEYGHSSIGFGIM